MILIKTNHSCLRVEISHMVSEYYGYNILRTIIFSKTYGEETLRCPYKDYSSLNKWKANWVFLSAFTLYNLLFCNDTPMKSKEGKFPSVG
jgi:hypothetical protein